MAVSSASPGTPRPLTEGLTLVPGSLRLILLRWALVVLSSIPAIAAAMAGIAATTARQPYFTDPRGPLPIIHVLRLLEALPPGYVAAVALTALFAVIGQQVLWAGALEWLAPQCSRSPSTAVLSTVLKAGMGRFWAMLRVMALAGVVSITGLMVIGALFERLADHGTVCGWTGRTLWLHLPLLRAAVSLLWAAIVGAWAFWCRVVLVADDRRVVRAAGLLVLRIWIRRPLGAPIFFVAITLVMLLGSAAVLAVWRQHPPVSALGTVPPAATWLLVILVQAMVWHWLLRTARLLYADARLNDLHSRPDGPLGIARLVGRLIRRRQR